MCGIFGMMGEFSPEEMREGLQAMAQVLRHRGPDDMGFHLEPERSVGMGMTRLSIVDRAGGHQPIYNEDRSLAIVLNGEIYNYLELRQELMAKGHRFRTRSDTEVILHLYEEEGPEGVVRLNGMFAFAILDRRRGELFLARDRFGIKHLLYSFYRGFVFASELKAFLCLPGFPLELDQQAVSDYFSLWYIPVPRCVVKSLHKLPQAHWMRVKAPGRVELHRYWEPDYHVRPVESAEALREEYFFHLRRAVRRQLMGEVPVGVYLSGGLDSGSIVAMLAEEGTADYHTFSVGFDHPDYDETPLIKATVEKFGTRHHHLLVTGEVEDIVDRVTYYQDQPLATPSYPYYLLSQEATKEVTVILSGEGGDEVLGGYDTYYGHTYLELYRRFPRAFRRWFREQVLGRWPDSFSKRGLDIQLKKFAEAAEYPPERAHVSWREIFSPGQKRELLNVDPEVDLDPYHAFREYIEHRGIPDLINRFMYADLSVFLPEATLALADRIGMAFSLEVRVPFLDNDFFDFVARIPVNWKVRRFTPKYMARRFLRGVLPDKVVKAPKLGFTPPMAFWFSGPLRDYFYDLLHQRCLRESGILDTRYALKVLDEHVSGRRDHQRRLMVLFGFSNWYRIFMGDRRDVLSSLGGGMAAA